MVRGKTKKTDAEAYRGLAGPWKKPGRLKSRKGVGLILAMVVVTAGGILIGAMFDMVSQHFFITEEFHKETYIDHTTLISEVQSMKGRITSSNADGVGEIQHHPSYGYDTDTPPAAGSLMLADLPFAAPWRIPRTRAKTIAGVRPQWIEVEVYDLCFDSAWINPADLAKPDCPSPLRMLKGKSTDSIGKPGDPLDGGYTGYGGNSMPEPEEYGAYLVRARLFDEHGDLLRTMEEAFVQRLPQ